MCVCVDDDDDVNSICVANTNCYLEIDSVTVAAAAVLLCCRINNFTSSLVGKMKTESHLFVTM